MSYAKNGLLWFLNREGKILPGIAGSRNLENTPVINVEITP